MFGCQKSLLIDNLMPSLANLPYICASVLVGQGTFLGLTMLQPADQRELVLEQSLSTYEGC